MTDSLISILRKNPTELSDAVKSFVKNFEVLKTNSATVSALKTFGKYTGVAEPLSSRKRAGSGKSSLPRKHGQMIKVQPTAVSRRLNTTVVGGRRCLHTV